jgi:hypothetical protein
VFPSDEAGPLKGKIEPILIDLGVTPGISAARAAELTHTVSNPSTMVQWRRHIVSLLRPIVIGRQFFPVFAGRLRAFGLKAVASCFRSFLERSQGA